MILGIKKKKILLINCFDSKVIKKIVPIEQANVSFGKCPFAIIFNVA